MQPLRTTPARPGLSGTATRSHAPCLPRRAAHRGLGSNTRPRPVVGHAQDPHDERQQQTGFFGLFSRRPTQAKQKPWQRYGAPPNPDAEWLDSVRHRWKAFVTDVKNELDPIVGRLSYDYYLWRTGTHNDLILIILAFGQLVVLSGVVRLTLLGSADHIDPTNLWDAVYNVLILSFGQQFPEGVEVNFGLQLFSVLVAIVGLASFALVLALVEQIVLEVIDSNVRRGSKVYEEGHTLVLGWCSSQRDLEVVWKLLAQLCGAYEGSGGRTIVVLTQRSKLEMENLSRKAIPDEERRGTRFVFREGSPLIPGDLKLVATETASTIVVISDQSRRPDETDAQTVRCAILVYDMNQTANIVVEIKTSNALPLITYSCGFNVMSVPTTKMNVRRLSKMIRTPYLGLMSQQVMDYRSGSHWDVQRAGTLAGTRFGELAFRFPQALVLGLFRSDTCEPVFSPDPEYMLNASDEIVMVRAVDGLDTCPALPKPIIPQRTDWTPEAPLSVPEIVDVPVQPLSSAVPLSLGPLAATISWDGIGALGFWSSRKRRVQADGNSGTRNGGSSGGGGGSASAGAGPSTSPANGNGSNGSNGGSGHRSGQGGAAAAGNGSASGAGQSIRGGSSGARAAAPGTRVLGSYLGDNLDSVSLDVEERRVSWEEEARRIEAVHQAMLMMARAQEDGGDGSPGGSGSDGSSAVGVATNGSTNGAGGSGSAGNGAAEALSDGGRSNPYTYVGSSPASPAPAAGTAVDDGAAGTLPRATSSYASAASSPSRAPLTAAAPSASFIAGGASSAAPTIAPASAASPSSRSVDVPPDLGAEENGLPPQGSANRVFMAPIEYYRESPDDMMPSTVVVFGWGEQSFMRNILRELDHGAGALAPGSTVVFVNDHDEETSLQAATQRVFRERSNIHCVHYRADPLQRSQLARLEVLTQIKAAIVLCDEQWVDPDMDTSNGIDDLCQQDMLRLDSMVMIVQLNVRKILADAGRADAINIICQKVAMVGLTRFEDRRRYPHGISVNFTSFAAKLLAQVAVNPKIMVAYAKSSDLADFKICDASELCNVGEELSFWDLMARAQAQGQVLLGWYELPSTPEHPMDVVINPCGEHERGRLQVWNTGDALRKFVVLRARDLAQSGTALAATAAAVGIEEEKQTQADWVLPSPLPETCDSPSLQSNIANVDICRTSVSGEDVAATGVPTATATADDRSTDEEVKDH